MKLLYVPSIAWPLIVLALITFVTSQFTGGIGLNAMGSDVFGGKRYIYQWVTIAGFFAISALPIDPRKRQVLAAGFFLSGITAIVSNAAFMLGEQFYFLFLLFPVELAIAQIYTENMLGGFTRVGGLAPASMAAIACLLLRYGVRGTFNPRVPWRGVLFVLLTVAGLFSGFRATVVMIGLFVAIQFVAEGLHKTKFLWIGGFLVVLLVLGLLPFAHRLPIAVQRCLTVLPLDLDATAEENARGSTDWRLEIWRSVVPDIPKYLWLGKGYAIDPKDIYFSQTHISRRIDAGYEGAVVTGDYHNGPLSLIIPFGIWGVLAFTWFLIAAFRVLWRNYKYGDPDITNINRFILVAFSVQLIFFLAVFGAFYMDLAKFVGLVGLSIAINHGVAGAAPAPVLASEPVPDPEPEGAFGGRLQPAFRGGRA